MLRRRVVRDAHEFDGRQSSPHRGNINGRIVEIDAGRHEDVGQRPARAACSYCAWLNPTVVALHIWPGS